MRREVKTGGNRSAKFGGTFIVLITIIEAVMRMVIEARLEDNAGASVPIRLAERLPPVLTALLPSASAARNSRG